MAKVKINPFTLHDAELVIRREEDFKGSKGKFCVKVAKKIVDGSVTAKELKEFESYSDFISLTFM